MFLGGVFAIFMGTDDRNATSAGRLAGTTVEEEDEEAHEGSGARKVWVVTDAPLLVMRALALQRPHL